MTVVATQPPVLTSLRASKGRWLLLAVVLVAVLVGVARRSGSRSETLPDASVAALAPPLASSSPAATAPSLPGAWVRLAACLETWRADRSEGSIAAYVVREQVMIDRVRGWIAEGDPTWFDTTSIVAWWLPLSGEGSAAMPSGLYAVVSEASTGCGAAIVN